MNETKGTGIFVNEGIYFQPYEPNPPDYPLGDSLTIQATGVVGALNLHRKLSDHDDLPVVARERRSSLGLQELVKNNEATYFPWDHIADVKKSWFMKTVTINMENGAALILKGEENKTAFELVSQKIEKKS